ncbi:MAG: type IV pilus assembly protein PilE [Paraglaciecola sp.]|jgi:type IV pilus assembly protein PilE
MFSKKGITLIELMIVLAIMGIIAAIALPSYQNQILRARRGDGITQLLQLQTQQESFRLENISYGTTAQLALPPGEYFTYTSSNVGATTYTLSATAKNSQTSDTSCTLLTLDQSMNKTPGSCW